MKFFKINYFFISIEKDMAAKKACTISSDTCQASTVSMCTFKTISRLTLLRERPKLGETFYINLKILWEISEYLWDGLSLKRNYLLIWRLYPKNTLLQLLIFNWLKATWMLMFRTLFSSSLWLKIASRQKFTLLREDVELWQFLCWQ